MAERSVIWKIATNFARARRDSDRLADSLERVQRQTEEMDDSSVSGNQKATQTTKQRSGALKEFARQAKAAAAAEKEQAKTSSQIADSSKKIAQVTKEGTQASKAHTTEVKKEVQATEELLRAQQMLARAQTSQKKSTLELQAAQQRLSSIVSKHGKDSHQYAAALLSVQRAEIAVESSSNRLSSSMRRVEQETIRANQAATAASGGFGRFGRKVRDAANGMANFPKAILSMGGSLLKLGAIFPVVVAGVGYLTTAISALSAGLTAMVGPVLSTVNVLATLPQALSVAGGAIATFIGAFSGIGDALKQGISAQQDAGKASKDLAKQEKQSARQIQQAQRGVRNAKEAAADSARNSARAIKDAQASVVDSMEAEYEAAKNLSAARKQAKRDIQDMRQALEDYELQERGASLSVEEARRRLQETLVDPGADSLAKRQAQLAYDEAIARMDSVRKEKKEADKKYKDAQKKGVEGSDSVIDAQKAEIDATKRVQEAQRNLADSRRDSARAARDSAEAVADAQQALRDAQEQSNEAMDMGATSAGKFQQAMAELSPAGRRFVQTLLGMRDEIKRLKFAAQEGLLPGLGEALTTMLKLVPLAERGLFQFGQVIGNVAKRSANLLTSDEFMPMWNRLLESNLKLLKTSGRGFTNLLEAVVYLMDAARPMTEWLFETVEGWTAYWKELAKSGNQTGSTAKKLDKAREVLEILGRTTRNIWNAFKGLGRAGSDLGLDLLKSFEKITKGWADTNNSFEGQNRLKAWFDASRKPLSEMRKMLGGIVRGIVDIGIASGDNFAEFLSRLSEVGGPLKDLLIQLQGDFGLALADLAKNLTEILVALTSSGEGGLTAFVETLNTFAEVLNLIVQNEQAAWVIRQFATAMGLLLALKFVGILTGIRSLSRMIGRSAGMWSKLFPNVSLIRGMGKKSTAAMKGAGRDMALGLRAGWRTSFTPFIAGMTNDMNRLIAAAKRRLRIKSPSRVFFLIGQQIAQGLIQGMNAMRGQVATSAATMSGAAVAGGNRAAKASVGVAVVSKGAKGSKKAPKAAGKADKATAKASKGGGKLGKVAGGAAIAVEGLALALSFLPGPVGEAANQFLMLSLVIGSLWPLIKGLGKGVLGLFKTFGKGGKAAGKFGSIFRGVGKIFLSLGKIVGKAVGLIGRVLMRLVGIVARAMMLIGRAMLANPWMLLIAALVIIVVLVIKYWDEIKAVVMKAINWMVNFIKDNWDIIKWFLGPMGLVIDQVVKHWDEIKKIFTVAIKAILSFIKKVWSGLKKFLSDPIGTAWDAIKKIWDLMKRGFKASVDFIVRLFKGAWAGLKALLLAPIKAGWNLIKPVWDTVQRGFQTGADAIKNTFDVLKSGLKKVWEGIKSVFTTPIEFVINKVIDEWLIGNVNKVLDAVGLDDLKLPTVGPVKFARGGQVDGYGNRDSVKALLMPGEFVMRKDAVKSIGVQRLHAMNEGRSFRGQKFNFGGEVSSETPAFENAQRYYWGEGVVNKAKDAGGAAWDATGGKVVGLAKDAWGTVKDVTGKVIDLAKVGASKGLELLLKPLRGSLDDEGSATLMWDAVKGVGNKLFDMAIGWVGGNEAEAPFPPSVADTGLGIAGQTIAAGVPAAQNYAQKHLKDFGWGQGQFPPLLSLWTKESGWRWNADNPNSSAYGIPQALPGSKMASAGKDWKTNPATQIRWGLGYIKQRYGSPAAAWAHSQQVGWYRRGGLARFATGGMAKRRRRKDEEFTPALLTPGEFVLNRDAVQQIGVGNLSRVNRSGASGSRVIEKKNVGGMRGHPHLPIQKFHRGGTVKGMKRGLKAKRVKALEYIAGVKRDGLWDARLDAKLKRGAVLDDPKFRYKASKKKDNKFIKWVNNVDPERVHRDKKYKVKKGDRVGDVLKEYFGAKSSKHLNAFLKANGFMKTVKTTKTVKTPGESGRLGAAIKFAKAQNGKPYIWGGVGPRGYDCSGFQSAITNVIKGNNPYRRLFATGSMGSALPRLGFKRGNGDYTVGWYTGSPGHTSGRLGSLNVESTGDHVRVGSAARSPNSFPNVMSLSGIGGSKSGTKTVHGTKKVGRYKLKDKLPVGKTVTVPNVPGWKGGRTWGQAKSRFNINSPQLMDWVRQLLPLLKKVPNRKKSQLLESYRNQRGDFTDAFGALNKALGLKKSKGYTGNTKKALKHVLDHTYGRKHDDFAYRPWKFWTPLESAIIKQKADNAKMQKWQNALEKIATWGFEELLEDLFQGGIDEKYKIAIGASKDKNLASQLNEQLKKAGNLSDEDFQNLIKLLAFLNSSANGRGLRDTARHLGLSDYETVQLWEKGTKAGRFKSLPAAKKNVMNDDVRKWRAGTFYANTGGEVPGSGNTDSVPAMLTPGEFVLRKEAAKALGLQNLWALNGLQKFNTGGLVMAPTVASMPTKATAGVSSRRMGVGAGGYSVEYNYDIDINNPIAEPGTRSMMKALQRQSVLGGGSSVKKAGSNG